MLSVAILLAGLGGFAEGASPAGGERSTAARAGDPARRDPPAVTAELTIRRRVVDAGGAPRGATPPGVRYRLERTRSERGWKTVMHLLEEERPLVRGADGDVSIDASLSISRVEDEGDGTSPRVFNRRGVEVRLPGTAQIEEWLAAPGALRRGVPPAETTGVATKADADRRNFFAGFLIAIADRPERRGAIQRRLGPPVDRVRGFDRHVVSSGNEVHETLVEPFAMVPVEVAVFRDGERVEVTRHSFQPGERGDLVRRGMRHERRLPGTSGDWLVVDVEFSNVVFDGGAR